MRHLQSRINWDWTCGLYSNPWQQVCKDSFCWEGRENATVILTGLFCKDLRLTHNVALFWHNTGIIAKVNLILLLWQHLWSNLLGEWIKTPTSCSSNESQLAEKEQILLIIDELLP